MPREQDEPVDFVLGDAPQPPPEPPAPPPRSGWATRRTLAGAAVVLVGVGLLIRALGGDGSGHPHPTPSASATAAPAPAPTTSASSPQVLVAVPSNQALVLTEAPPPPRCPETIVGGHLCADDQRLPQTAITAVRTAYRGSRIDSAFSQVQYTDDLRPTASVVYRRLTGTVGPAQLLVLVRPVTQGDRNETVAGDNGQHAVGFVTRLAHGLTVRTQLTAPSGKPPSLHTLSKLAADSRLVAP